MESKETISGKKILDLFDKLLKERTVIKLNLLGQDFERLSIVTGVEDRKGTPYLLIDYPDGFREAVQEAGEARLLFQLTDRDKISYAFRTTFREIAGDDIWIEIPDYVERIQRRRYFRMAPPLGTKMVFLRDAVFHETSVINVSMGGALIGQVEAKPNQLRLYVDDTLSDITLICDEEPLNMRLGIKKAVIIRVEKSMETGRFRYALHFMEMGNQEQIDLGKWIYLCQREALRKRSLLT
jgi:c-di-GMP-binding flagellar brake protein YcgR